MPKRYGSGQPERVARMALDRLGEDVSPLACGQALGPKLDRPLMPTGGLSQSGGNLVGGLCSFRVAEPELCWAVPDLS
jgi:hypothetical protein